MHRPALCPPAPAGEAGTYLFLHPWNKEVAHLRKSMCSTEVEVRLPLEIFHPVHTFPSQTLFTPKKDYLLFPTHSLFCCLDIFAYAEPTAGNALLRVRIFTEVELPLLSLCRNSSSSRVRRVRALPHCTFCPLVLGLLSLIIFLSHRLASSSLNLTSY